MNNAKDEDIFSQAGLPAREQVTEWVKIKEKIGDKVSGIFMGWWVSKSNKPGFKDQIGIAIRLADGKVVGVSVGDTGYMRSRIEPSKVGDRVGLKYEGDKDTGQIQKAKIVKFYNPDLQARQEAGEAVVISKPEIVGNANPNAPVDNDVEDEDPF